MASTSSALTRWTASTLRSGAAISEPCSPASMCGRVVLVHRDGHDGHGLRAAVTAAEIDEEEPVPFREQPYATTLVGVAAGRTTEGGELRPEPVRTVHRHRHRVYRETPLDAVDDAVQGAAFEGLVREIRRQTR